MVRVVLAALNGLQHLADDHDGRVTHVVLYVLQAQVDGFFFGRIRDHHFVTVPVQHVGHQIEMDRRHLGSQNGMGLLAVVSEVGTFRHDQRFVIGHVSSAEDGQ